MDLSDTHNPNYLHKQTYLYFELYHSTSTDCPIIVQPAVFSNTQFSRAHIKFHFTTELAVRRFTKPHRNINIQKTEKRCGRSLTEVTYI